MVDAPSGAFRSIRRLLSATTWCSRSVLGIAAVVGISAASVDGDVRASALSLLDPSAILAARSPGARAPGALFQTKPSARAGRGHVSGQPPASPVERILPVSFLPDAAIGEDLPMPLTGPGVAFGDLPSQIGLVTSGHPPVGFVPILGGSGGGVGGGVGGTPPVTTAPPGIDQPPVSAVPEPATWASMVVGFGLVGALARRRRARAGNAGVASSAR